MEITVTTLQGFEHVLAKEIEQWGGEEIEILNRAVKCQGDLLFLYKCNLCLRTALRVLKPIHHFEAADELEFYSKIQEIKWPDKFKINQSFLVHAVVNSEVFTHSRYMALKTKDAIVDQFRDIFGRRPNVSTYDPDLIINVHITGTECTVSLDSSGESLHKRAYKVASHSAPLNEVLAAGILLQTGFEEYDSFHDPMCGSGTFVSEALMIHTGCPANMTRDEFAFMKWKDFEIESWRALRKEMISRIRKPKIRFSGADIDRSITFAAKKNIIQLPHSDQVTLYKKDFFKDDPDPKPAFLIMNPPYDVRLESEDIDQLYGDIGTTLKHKYTGSRACIFSGNLGALKKVGLKPTIKKDLLNGSIPSKLMVYDLYEGSVKAKN